jgi:hypothetical protein
MQNVNASQIRPHMSVFALNGEPFGTVDHTDPGNTIKLTKDEQGQHHWIPMSWVTHVDEHVHIDRPGMQAMREWTSEAPQEATAASSRTG